MVGRAYQQRSLVEVLLPDGDKLLDPVLRRIDAILDDEALVDRVAEALARRHPQSQGRGRPGTPAAVLLRMLVLKHLRDWSFADCEREVRASLVYRAFCRIDGEHVPDAKTLMRLAHLLDEAVLKDVLARLGQVEDVNDPQVYLPDRRRVVVDQPDARFAVRCFDHHLLC